MQRLLLINGPINGQAAASSVHVLSKVILNYNEIQIMSLPVKKQSVVRMNLTLVYSSKFLPSLCSSSLPKIIGFLSEVPLCASITLLELGSVSSIKRIVSSTRLAWLVFHDEVFTR